MGPNIHIYIYKYVCIIIYTIDLYIFKESPGLWPLPGNVPNNSPKDFPKTSRTTSRTTTRNTYQQLNTKCLSDVA